MTFRIDSVFELPPEVIARNPQLQELAKIKDGPGKNKYNAKRTTIDGITFDSAKEANRYQELLMLERSGQISGLRRQVRYELQAGFVGMTGKWVRPICYVADADYWEQGGHVVEDTKSPATRKIKSYQIKRKMFEAKFRDIEFREV